MTRTPTACAPISGRTAAVGWLQRHAWLPILVVALVVRLPGLSDKPLWYDEAFAVLLSARGPEAMLRATLSPQAGVAADVHPLGYYGLLWGWGRLFGTSPLAMRSLSVLIGIGLVGLAYFGVRSALGPRLAVWTGGLAALSPFQVHYAQEVRMYSLLALELAAAALLFRAAVQRGGWARWVGFSLLAAAAQYTHALAALFLIPLAMLPLIARDWRAARATLLSGLLAVLLYLPWLIRLPLQIGRVQTAYWIRPPGPADFLRTLVMYLGGSPLPGWGLPLVLFSVSLVIGLGGWHLLRVWRGLAPGAALVAESAYLSIAPPLLMAVVSLRLPIYLDRAMLPAAVAFLVFLAGLLGGEGLPSRMRWTARFLVGASFLLGLFSYWTYRGFPYAPFAEIVAAVGDRLDRGELLLHSNKLTALPAVYYSPDLPQEYLADPPGSGSDTLALATQRELGRIAHPDAQGAVGDAPGVWFLIFTREREEYATLGAPEHPALGWLNANFSESEITLFGEAELHHFAGRRPASGG